MSKDELIQFKQMTECRQRILTIDGEQVYNNLLKLDTYIPDAILDDHLDCDDPPPQFEDLFDAMVAFVDSDSEYKWIKLPSHKIEKKVMKRFKYEVSRQGTTQLNMTTKVLKIIGNKEFIPDQIMWLLRWLNMHFPVIHTLIIADHYSTYKEPYKVKFKQEFLSFEA